MTKNAAIQNTNLLQSADTLLTQSAPCISPSPGHMNDSQVMDVLDHSYDAIWITNADGIVMKVTKAWEKLFNCCVHDVEGRHITDVMNFYQASSATKHVLETGEPYTVLHDLTNGMTVLVSAVPVFGVDDKLQYVISNTRNVTPDSTIFTHMNNYYRELQFLRARANQGADSLVFESGAMQNVMKTILLIKDLECTVMLLGDTGTGKNTLARYMHVNSIRADQPFIEINCAAIPEQLLESELFGYEQGSFTGALKGGKPGMFELANHGTLVLDEIDSMPLRLQTKLLSAIQDRSITRLGGKERVPLDVRLVCACKPEIKELVGKGLFREDLFYRINVIPIEIPPLAQRKKDVRALFDHYLNEYSKKYRRNITVDEKAYKILENYTWPGNIRELRNIVERLVILNTTSTITPEDIPFGEHLLSNSVNSSLALDEQIGYLEKKLIDNALKKYGSTRKAAENLGITQSSLMRRKKKYRDSNVCDEEES